MAIDFSHEFVGRSVVYTASHPGAKGEQGMVTSVNVDANIVFVRYGSNTTSAATSADDRLVFLDGTPVRLPTFGYALNDFIKDWCDGPGISADELIEALEFKARALARHEREIA